MKPIIEHLELKQTNFTKWLFLGLSVLSLFAFFISFNKEGNGKWICLGGFIFFGFGFWMSLKNRIIINQDGFTEHNGFKPQHVLWQEIRSIHYETAYHGHGVSLRLSIWYGDPLKMILLHVKQYNKDKMQRFFEILNEHCPDAEKNEHFVKKATGVMGWKDKIKMY